MISVLRIKDAAKLLGVSREVIKQAMLAGKIPYRQLSARVYLIPRKGLEKLFQAEGK